MTLYSRADLEAYADAQFTANGNGEITGPDLNDGYKRAVDSALIRNESGDIGAGLAWSSDALRIAVAGVTLAMMENRAQATLIGRAAGAGTGVPTELSASQAKTLLAIAAGDVSGLSAFATSTDLANATGTLAIARIADGSITLAKNANIAASTILGNNTAGAAAPIALTAAQTRTVLGLAAIATSGSASDLSTGTLPIARIADGDVTLAKLANLAQSTIIGRAAAAGTGVPTALTATQVKTLLAIAASDVSGLAAIATSGSASDLGTGTLPIARIADGDVTLAKMANLAQATIIGRASGAGTGVPTALTSGQVSTILGLAAIATSGSASDLSIGTVPNARISGSYTNLTSIAMSDDLFMTAANALIRKATSDGADTGSITLVGGGTNSSTRGASVGVYGNEHGVNPGDLLLQAGDTGVIKLNGTAISAFATSTDLANASGTLDIARIADATVTLAKMANLAQATIIGRASGAGTGVPTALTATQVKTLLAIAISDVTSLQTSLDAKVDLSGDTMTGALTINMATPLFTLDATASGQTKAIRWRTNGSTRFQLQSDNSAESGSDAGSNLSVTRYDDSGAVISGAPFKIIRSTGEAQFIATAAAAAVSFTFNNNASAAANVETRIDLSPGSGLAGVRSAYLSAINEGSNTIRLAFGGSYNSGAAPVELMFLKRGLVVGASMTDQGLGTINAQSGYYYANNKFPDYQTSASNGNVTVTCVSPITTFVTTATLTADRTLTVPTTNAVAGWICQLKRTGGDTGGPWVFNINSGLATLLSGVSKTLVYTGSAWILYA